MVWLIVSPLSMLQGLSSQGAQVLPVSTLPQTREGRHGHRCASKKFSETLAKPSCWSLGAFCFLTSLLNLIVLPLTWDLHFNGGQRSYE